MRESCRRDDGQSIDYTSLVSIDVLISDCKWRLVAFPKGNNGDYLSLYLDVADFETLHCGWKKYCSFRIRLEHSILEIFLLFTQCSSSILVKCVKQSTTLMESRQLGVPAMLPLFKLHENDGGDLLKKTSLGINANGTKQVENSVKPPPKKT
ncbi:hypothetical protein YC2023_077942 [Brassica napus]